MASGSLLGTPSSSPFSPHIGKTPHSLVGRDGLLSEVGNGLVSGPDDQRYTSILMGVRGSGKTVALNEIEDRAAAEGWVVLSMDAGTPGLLDRIVHAISQTERTYDTLHPADDRTKRSVEKSIGMRVGPLVGKIATTEDRDLRSRMGLREHLTHLVQAAQRNGASVLLTVDELHGIDRTEGRRLSNDLQHITKRAEMPLAFLGAGLLELKHTLMRDRKVTFFHRCEHFDMPALSTADAVVGFAGPIRDSGGAITGDALRLAAEAVDGSPYRLQVIGDVAWKIAGAPDKEIDVFAVETAIDNAERVINTKISVPAWHDLSEGDRRLLGAVAVSGGIATSEEAAQGSLANKRAASNALGRLADLGYLDRPSRGVFRLTALVPREVILNEIGHAEDSILSSRVFSKPKCRKLMPRARAYCVLPQDHSGGCRSK